MRPNFRKGVAYGTGAAINIELGFIPDYVKVVNTTDGDLVTEYFHGIDLGFDGGGTTEIVKGDWIKSTTSGAYGRVKQVIVDSGAWADGDAAGVFILDDETVSGTFANNDVLERMERGGVDGVAAIADATGAAGTNGIATAAAVAAATGNAAVSAYAGSSSNADGFTIGLTVSEDAKVLHWIAARDD